MKPFNRIQHEDRSDAVGLDDARESRVDLRVKTTRRPEIKITLVIEINGKEVERLVGDAIVGALHSLKDTRALAIGYLPDSTIDACVKSLQEVVKSVYRENDEEKY